MRMRLGRATFAAVGLAGVLLGTLTPVWSQTQTDRGPRTADGKPNLNGIWQAMNTANWDIQDHAARQGPVIALGAAFSVPAGLGVVEGNEIPYQPWALAKKKENAENWLTLDPEVKCYLPGCPARDLHAVSVSDRPDAEHDPDGVRVRERQPHRSA